MTVEPNKTTILVTGASGGVGRVLVRLLVDKGYGVIGSVLNQAEMEEADAQELTGASFFIAEFSDSETALSQIAEALAPHASTLGAAIGCAGINPFGPIETTPIAMFRRTIDINVTANVAVYQAAIPHLRSNGGRFIFVSSSAGKVAMPLLGYYTASKFALEGLADAMRLEAGQWNIPISLIEPGGIATNMSLELSRQLETALSTLNENGRENYGQYFSQFGDLGNNRDVALLTPEAVAEGIIDVLEADTPDTRYPMGNAIGIFDRRRSSTDQEMDKAMNRMMPGRRSV